MVKMATLGLLLVIVVVTAIVVYLAGLVWLARHEVRRDETPPPEICPPEPTQSALSKAPRDIGDVVPERTRPTHR